MRALLITYFDTKSLRMASILINTSDMSVTEKKLNGS